MERVVGIEPTFSAWKAGVLPIYDTRLTGRGDRSRTCDLMVPNHARYHLRHTPVDTFEMYRNNNDYST